MSISKATTDLSTLKINMLTEQMYEDALSNNEINQNELYMTEFEPGYTVENSWTIMQQSTTAYPFDTGDGYALWEDDYIYSTDGSAPAYLKVSYNNTEYICQKQTFPDNPAGYSYGAPCSPNLYYSEDTQIFDFTNYPFNIRLMMRMDTTCQLNIITQSATNYTIAVSRGSQTITTTPDFNAAVSHVLETNLQSVEGGSY